MSYNRGVTEFYPCSDLAHLAPYIGILLCFARSAKKILRFLGTVIGGYCYVCAKRQENFKTFRYYYRGYCYVSREAQRKF